ncbi:hypothetical protein G7046_g4203 [Stylonectria norvegica]|nr:hypothetical protein G7046_g4203 [Stylonectria norvegica]
MMIPSISALALAGLASAVIEPRHVLFEARDQPVYHHPRGISLSEPSPCQHLSQVYAAAEKVPGKPLLAAVKPSIVLACLKDVPLDRERDVALLEYLEPFVEFQSTLENLADPPEEYLVPGVDVWGGFNTMKESLTTNYYANQYEAMTELRSIFAAAADNHFLYTPNLLNLIYYVRYGLDFVSVSKDGISAPHIFGAIDVRRGNMGDLDYHPSAVESIDGIPVSEWLKDDAVKNMNNYQDPDAQYNALFGSVARTAAGGEGTALVTNFEIPDNYTVGFYNGTEKVVENTIIYLATTNFTNIDSGPQLHEVFELVPEASTTAAPEPSVTAPPASSTSGTEAPATSTTTEEPEPTLSNYPWPVAMHSKRSISSYFLNETDYQDTVVLSILSFLPIGFQLGSPLNYTEFVLEAQEVFIETVEKAKKDGRTKLVIDLQANGGGSIALSQVLYRLLFPDGKWSSYDRYRDNPILSATSEADYSTLNELLISPSSEAPIGPDGKYITHGQDWFGPYNVQNQNVTAAFQDNRTRPWDGGDNYYNGEQGSKSPIPIAPFKPEDIIIVTDGTCASACNIFTGLLTRNEGVRTIALGGRPLLLAMQAMGGVKGSMVTENPDIVKVSVSFLEAIANNPRAKNILSTSGVKFPQAIGAPLQPVAGGSVNSRSAYTIDDLEGYNLHFRYEAANCKLFFTQRMTKDISEIWRKVSDIAWKGASCVVGSTVNEDGTIGNEALKFDARVKSNARAIVGPGALA